MKAFQRTVCSHLRSQKTNDDTDRYILLCMHKYELKILLKNKEHRILSETMNAREAYKLTL